MVDKYSKLCLETEKLNLNFIFYIQTTIMMLSREYFVVHYKTPMRYSFSKAVSAGDVTNKPPFNLPVSYIICLKTKRYGYIVAVKYGYVIIPEHVTGNETLLDPYSVNAISMTYREPLMGMSPIVELIRRTLTAIGCSDPIPAVPIEKMKVIVGTEKKMMDKLIKLWNHPSLFPPPEYKGSLRTSRRLALAKRKSTKTSASAVAKPEVALPAYLTNWQTGSGKLVQSSYDVSDQLAGGISITALHAAIDAGYASTVSSSDESVVQTLI